MICPKCRSKIDENAVFCPSCHLKVKMLCSNCQTLNNLGEKICSNCKKPIIKFCPKCKSANLPEAKKCRKCNFVFSKPVSSSSEKLSTSKMKLKSAIENKQVRIISILGKDLVSKGFVLNFLKNELRKTHKIVEAKSSQFSQISPFGLVVQMLLNHFELDFYITSLGKFARQNAKKFEFLKESERDLLFNLLYPAKSDKIENIYKNNKKSKSVVQKVFKHIMSEGPTVFIINPVDFIDTMSYEILTEIAGFEFHNQNHKFVLSSSEFESGNIQPFYVPELSEENRYNIVLNTFSQPLAFSIIDSFVKNKELLPYDLKVKIFKHSKGNGFFVEHVLMDMFESRVLRINKNKKFQVDSQKLKSYKFPSDFASLLERRIGNISEINPFALRLLFFATLAGEVFDLNLLFDTSEKKASEFLDAIALLQKRGFLIQMGKNKYSFKSNEIWKILYEIFKKNTNYLHYNKIFLDVLLEKILSQSCVLPIVCQNLKDDLKAQKFWLKNANLSVATGDVDLYIIFQKQTLRILEKLNYADREKKISDIEENIGKLLFLKNPDLAAEHLSNALRFRIEEDNKPKIFEISSYLLQSASMVQNNQLVEETVDLVCSRLESVDYEVERAIIKSKKFEALFNFGKLQTIVHIADSEILNIFEEVLSKGLETRVPQKVIYSCWVKTQIWVLLSLALRCDKNFPARFKQVLATLDLNSEIDTELLMKIKFSEALYQTMKGFVDSSKNILKEIIGETANYSKKFVSKINILKTLNSILSGEFDFTKENLYEYAILADESNDHVSKSIFKIFLAIVLKRNCEFEEANRILESLVESFAKNKLATSAMLCWYLISSVSIKLKGTRFALDVANRALEIAKSSAIRNYWFCALFLILLSDIYLYEGDYEASKMYLEKSMQIVEQNDIQYLKLLIALANGRLCEKEILIDEQNKQILAFNALKLYNNALSISQSLNLQNYVNLSNLAKESLLSFCSVNCINF